MLNIAEKELSDLFEEKKALTKGLVRAKQEAAANTKFRHVVHILEKGFTIENKSERRPTDA